MNHRHRSRTAFIVFLLCLPLALIAYFVFSFSNEKLNADEIKTMIISHEGGEPDEYTDRESISFYTELFLSSSKLNSPMRELEEEPAVNVRLEREDSVLTYVIYPELSETGCMFTDQKGVCYLIPKESARSMLSRREFAFLYAESALPELKVISGSKETEVIPASYGWYYKKQNGEYAEYTEKSVADGSESYSIYANRTNTMVFSRKPDELNVTICDSSGNVLPQNELGSLVFGNDTLLKVTVSATWLRTGAGNCDGRASYEFELLYDIPAILSVSSDTVEIGSGVQVDVRFLNNDETVYLRSDLELGELYFTDNEGIKTAILGVADTNHPGKYSIEYTIGDNTGYFDISLTGKAQDERTEIYRMSVSEELYEQALSNAAKEELNAIIESIYSVPPEKTYSVLGFAKPVASGSLVQPFGTRVIANITNNTETHLYYSIGDTYSVSKGAGIYAASKGRIAYTGECGALGKVVIIDHGCGVFSWYYGLDSIERGEGTEVGPSTLLGKAGVNPYDNTSTVGFCVTAGKVFIDPTP